MLTVKIIELTPSGFFETGYATESGKSIDFSHKKVTVSKKPHTLSKSNKRLILYHIYTLLF